MIADCVAQICLAAAHPPTRLPGQDLSRETCKAKQRKWPPLAAPSKKPRARRFELSSNATPLYSVRRCPMFDVSYLWSQKIQFFVTPLRSALSSSLPHAATVVTAVALCSCSRTHVGPGHRIAIKLQMSFALFLVVLLAAL